MHDIEELLVAQAVVPVQVEDLEHGVKNVLRQIVSRCDPHGSLELGCSERKTKMKTICGGETDDQYDGYKTRKKHYYSKTG